MKPLINWGRHKSELEESAELFDCSWWVWWIIPNLRSVNRRLGVSRMMKSRVGLQGLKQNVSISSFYFPLQQYFCLAAVCSCVCVCKGNMWCDDSGGSASPAKAASCLSIMQNSECQIFPFPHCCSWLCTRGRDAFDSNCACLFESSGWSIMCQSGLPNRRQDPLCSCIQMWSFINSTSRCKLLSNMLDAPVASLHIGAVGRPLSGHQHISPANSLHCKHNNLLKNCFIH